MKGPLIKAAFVGFGEVNSPQQLIRDKCLMAREEIESLGINILTTDHVTDDPRGLDIKRAIKDLSKSEFDFLIICIAGWIPSQIKEEWDFEKPADEDFLKKGITYYLAIKKIIEENKFDAISIKDVDGMKKILSFPPAMIFMLLSDEMNLCTIPENDAMGAVTQLIVKHITGQCAAYLEFYEFFEKSVLLGVPDFVPAEVVNGRVKVTPAAFGGLSGGLLNISTMKTGRLTMVRMSNTGDQYTMHICTGEGKLKSWEEAGWAYPAPQLPSLEIFPDIPVEDFAQCISGQHYIIAYGDHMQSLRDFCFLKNIKTV